VLCLGLLQAIYSSYWSSLYTDKWEPSPTFSWQICQWLICVWAYSVLFLTYQHIFMLSGYSDRLVGAGFSIVIFMGNRLGIERDWTWLKWYVTNNSIHQVLLRSEMLSVLPHITSKNKSLSVVQRISCRLHSTFRPWKTGFTLTYGQNSALYYGTRYTGPLKMSGSNFITLFEYVTYQNRDRISCPNYLHNTIPTSIDHCCSLRWQAVHGHGKTWSCVSRSFAIKVPRSTVLSNSSLWDLKNVIPACHRFPIGYCQKILTFVVVSKPWQENRQTSSSSTIHRPIVVHVQQQGWIVQVACDYWLLNRSNCEVQLPFELNSCSLSDFIEF
jgi:hypothetical protein